MYGSKMFQKSDSQFLKEKNSYDFGDQTRSQFLGIQHCWAFLCAETDMLKWNHFVSRWQTNPHCDFFLGLCIETALWWRMTLQDTKMKWSVLFFKSFPLKLVKGIAHTTETRTPKAWRNCWHCYLLLVVEALSWHCFGGRCLGGAESRI